MGEQKYSTSLATVKMEYQKLSLENGPVIWDLEPRYKNRYGANDENGGQSNQGGDGLSNIYVLSFVGPYLSLFMRDTVYCNCNEISSNTSSDYYTLKVVPGGKNLKVEKADLLEIFNAEEILAQFKQNAFIKKAMSEGLDPNSAGWNNKFDPANYERFMQSKSLEEGLTYLQTISYVSLDLTDIRFDRFSIADYDPRTNVAKVRLGIMCDGWCENGAQMYITQLHLELHPRPEVINYFVDAKKNGRGLLRGTYRGIPITHEPAG